MRTFKFIMCLAFLQFPFSRIQPAHGTMTIVMDQIGPDTSWTSLNTLHASQDFEPANNAFDVVAIDDFTMPVGAPLQVVSVEGVFGEYSSTGGWPEAVTGFRAEFYLSAASAAANLTGNAGTCTVAPVDATLITWGANNGFRKVTLDLTDCNIMLAGGSQFWVGIIPIQNFAGAGQVGVTSAQNPGVTPGGSNGFQANPGGGFLFPGNLQMVNPGRDFAYRVTVVPEPTTLSLLGLAAALLVCARRSPALK